MVSLDLMNFITAMNKVIRLELEVEDGKAIKEKKMEPSRSQGSGKKKSMSGARGFFTNLKATMGGGSLSAQCTNDQSPIAPVKRTCLACGSPHHFKRNFPQSALGNQEGNQQTVNYVQGRSSNCTGPTQQ